jgi:murein DD-endopeptidase MepM/ murein hydrolase activator NlpD
MRPGSRAAWLQSAAVIARIAAAGLIVAVVLAPAAGARLTEPSPQLPPVPVPERELFAVPLNGNLGSPFGYRWGRLHEGIDIEGWAHTKVHAALDGKVTRVGWLGGYSGYGLVVKVRHSGGIVTMYAHLARSDVTKGQLVERGQLIGRIGSTGYSTSPHLHFEVRTDGGLRNPLGYLP